MTNNILHETFFSITSRHTFLFLIHLAYYKHDTNVNRPQSFKRFPKKVQWGTFRKAVMDRKIASPLERISLCCSVFHVNFPIPVSLFASFLFSNTPQCRVREEVGKNVSRQQGFWTHDFYRGMLRPWKSYRKKRQPRLVEKSSRNASCSSFSNSGETSMPRKRKMRGTARSALKRNPSGFSCNFSGAGTGKARLDGKRSLKPDGKGKSGRQMNQLPASGKTAPEQACLFAVGRCPVERHPWTREGKFYGSPSFFLFPPPSCDALQMTPSLLPPGPGAPPMGGSIPPEIDSAP
ncbi:hypothetical protein, partial [Akkermansia massiliensis]